MTPGLIGLTLLALVTWAVELRHYFRPVERTPSRLFGWLTVVLIGLLVLMRWLDAEGWQPLHSHLDGLLLIGLMLGASQLYLRSKPRLGRIGLVIWPVLAFLLAWALCASAWTYRPFKLDSLEHVWRVVHLGGVYAGTLFAVLAAIFGGLYLFVYRAVKRHDLASPQPGLPSLEWTESAVIRFTTLGFVTLTIGLISGVVVVADTPGRLGSEWWLSPKVVLATASWLAFALAMNVRTLSLFRGPRAAWLAITGLVLLLGVHGLVTSWPDPKPVEETVVPVEQSREARP